MKTHKRSLISCLLGFVLLVPGAAFAIPYASVYQVDSLVAYDSLGNSGDGTEKNWINGLVGPGYDYTKYDTNNGSGWEAVTDGPAGTNLWAYDFGVGANPDYFLIKTGNQVALAADAPSYVVYDTFLYQNLTADRFAVIDFNTFVKYKVHPTNGNVTVSDFEVGKLSHIGYTDGDDVPPIPEPSTLLLLGAGLVGLAVYRRRKS